jgi:hypothetical protein
MGITDRQTDIDEEGDRRREPQARHDPAGDVEVRHRVLGDGSAAGLAQDFAAA